MGEVKVFDGRSCVLSGLVWLSPPSTFSLLVGGYSVNELGTYDINALTEDIFSAGLTV